MKLLLTPAALMAAASLHLQAANVIVNGSFELTDTAITPDTANPAWGDQAAAAGLQNWTVSSGTGAALANGDFGDVSGPPYFLGNGSNIPYRYPTDGNTYLTTNSDNTSTLTQTIGGLSAGDVALSIDTIRMYASGTGTFTVRLEIFDGDDDSATGLYDQTIDVALQAQETWVETTGSFSNTGSDLFVRMTLTDAVNGAQIGVDDLILDHTPVPEPSVLVLFGVAGGWLLGRRRR